MDTEVQNLMKIRQNNKLRQLIITQLKKSSPEWVASITQCASLRCFTVTLRHTAEDALALRRIPEHSGALRWVEWIKPTEKSLE